ncbi:uncharacterized protein LOC131293712 [Anopheles ziemanni]|uniref:uncharacterized protein LOC131264496 n=1 Tax=Anopheles coustani TaxID=139045 RepID=UPI0026594857|nr:uncharacterized protein LOC131264496 [Anopheles coustani]XP_058177769.1 uncharacterized protein LOC131293712 [Anopheles ziemanni]
MLKVMKNKQSASGGQSASGDAVEEQCRKTVGIIRRQDTAMRKSVTPKERLLVTLRYLATGERFTNLQYLFRVSRQLISKIVPEVCKCLTEALVDFVKLPSTNNEWLEVATKFKNRWGFPHVIGAIDGKHVRIIAPHQSGSDYFNYKKKFSIVLLAIGSLNYGPRAACETLSYQDKCGLTLQLFYQMRPA